MNENCIFCKIINGDIPCYKIYENETVISFLSIDPVTYGHTLVIPKKHVLDYPEIDLETLKQINEVGKIVYQKLETSLNPNGMKLVQNNGSIQEVKHYHLHIIPIYDNEPENKEDLEKVFENILK